MIQWFPAQSLAGALMKGFLIVLLISFAALQASRLASWLPWSAEKRIERVARDRDRLAAEAAVRREEARAMGAQVSRVEQAHRQTSELNTITLSAIHESRSAPDANQSLDPERADRLRLHDHSLCERAEGICEAVAAPSGSAGAGAAPVRNGHPSGRADLG